MGIILNYETRDKNNVSMLNATENDQVSRNKIGLNSELKCHAVLLRVLRVSFDLRDLMDLLLKIKLCPKYNKPDAPSKQTDKHVAHADMRNSVPVTLIKALLLIWSLLQKKEITGSNRWVDLHVEPDHVSVCNKVFFDVYFAPINGLFIIIRRSHDGVWVSQMIEAGLVYGCLVLSIRLRSVVFMVLQLDRIILIASYVKRSRHT